MGNFQKGGNNRGGGGFGGKPNFQKKGDWGNDRGGNREVTMYKATCSECGKSCEVPFRPTGEKPVFCSDCFSAKREGGDRNKPRPSFGDRAPKREFNDRTSGGASFNPASVNNEMKKQLSEISMKLDRLVGALEKIVPMGDTTSSEVTSKVEAKKTTLKATVKKALETKVAKKKVVAKKKK